MQQRSRNPVLIKSQAQWRAITSPARVELVEAVRVAGPSSIAELALLLDRPADSLYHHVRQLVNAGILTQLGVRRVGRQTEAVFDLASERIAFDYDPDTGRNSDRWIKLARTLLRTTDRLLAASVSAAGLEIAGPAKTLWSRVETARLTPADLRRLNEHLYDIEKLLDAARARGEGRLFNLTLFCFPIARSRHAAPPRRQRPRRRRQGAPLLEIVS